MLAIREGTVLAGKYRVERVLGAGGMGMVVAAIHTQLDERVALKFMLPEALAQGDASQRFLREARAAVKLKSEHVAKVLDVGTLETGAPYIVMEYLEGCDLGEVLRSRGPLPLSEAAEYMLHACDGLAEAHAVGIVHRDIKPANLFVTRRPDGAPLVKVLDFGISKASPLGDSGANALTGTAALLGTPLYMSPEQMKSSRDVDARSDVWSLGVVLYEALCGRVPFEGETVGALMAKVLVETPAPPRVIRPDLPEPMAVLIAGCLEKDPAKRCPHVAEIAARLAPFAPPRARPLAERAFGVLRVQGASFSGGTVASRPALDNVPAAAPTAMATASSWAEGRDVAQRRRGPGLRIVAGLGALAAVGGVAAAAVSMRSAPRGAAEGAATAIPPAATAAVSLVPLSEPAAPPPATTGSASAVAPVVPAPPPNPTPQPASKRLPRAPATASVKPTAEAPASPPQSTPKQGTAGHKDDL